MLAGFHSGSDTIFDLAVTIAEESRTTPDKDSLDEEWTREAGFIRMAKIPTLTTRGVADFTLDQSRGRDIMQKMIHYVTQ